jgi:transcriptional antiterminator RfaH
MANLWYALHVKPHKEPAVAGLLEAKGYEVYYPVLHVKPVNPRSRKERPFFPGYLFVCLELSESGLSILRWTEGTHGLVEFGGEPASVPDNLIEELKERLADLELRDLSGPAPFEKGDRVRIVDGAFEGYEAIFDTTLPDRDRVQVLLTYLRDQPKKLRIASS